MADVGVLINKESSPGTDRTAVRTHANTHVTETDVHLIFVIPFVL